MDSASRQPCYSVCTCPSNVSPSPSPPLLEPRGLLSCKLCRALPTRFTRFTRKRHSVKKYDCSPVHRAKQVHERKDGGKKGSAGSNDTASMIEGGGYIKEKMEFVVPGVKTSCP